MHLHLLGRIGSDRCKSKTGDHRAVFDRAAVELDKLVVDGSSNRLNLLTEVVGRPACDLKGAMLIPV